MYAIVNRLKPRLKWLRLAIGAASTLFGLLAFVPAPSRIFWMLGVGVTEWGHLFFLFALIPLLPGLRSSRPAKFGALFGIIGAALALSTICRAAFFSNDLSAKLENTFGRAQVRFAENAPARPAPFVLSDVLLGVPCPPVSRKSVVFWTCDRDSLQMDIYTPMQSSGRLPLVVTIHGGAWRGGDRTQLPAWNYYLAARGYAVAAIDHRLSPKSQFPGALEDVRNAVAYLKEHASELGADAQRIVLIGRSSGGHLALLAAYTSDDPAIRGVVSIYAPTDMVFAYDNPCNPLVLNSKEVLENFLGGDPRQAPKKYTDASPILFAGAKSPPTLLIHGERDDVVFTIHSERLAERLNADGRQYFLLRIPWGNHGCDANLNGPGGQISLFAIERFLAAVMR